MEEILAMRGICKGFPGVRALEDVSLSIEKGEVHALVGENGAGKSTLMNILSGMYQADSGDIIVEGKKVQIANTKEAINLGISMIYQELTSIPEMTVAENIFLGREITNKFKAINRKEINQKALELFKEMGINLDPKVKMKKLNIAKKQLVEIIKATSYESKVIIMDEPTSALTDKEVLHLFELIRLLKQRGVSILYISHKLEEIFEIADRVSVLRNGKLIGTKNVNQTDKETLISMMIGKELNDLFPKDEDYAVKDENVLEIKGLTKDGLFRDISFNVRRGEVLGIAGLMGSGRTEIAETIFGMRKVDSGEIFVNGKKVIINDPKDAIKNGIFLVPEDRKLMGLNLIASVKDNITLPSLSNYCKFGVIDKRLEKKIAYEQVKALDIKTPSINQRVKFLSGGNQQKIVVSKCLLVNADVIILDEPTRGIDVGAKAEIYSIINSLAKIGKAIIVISSELPEIMGLSDSIIVLFEGVITGKFNKNEKDPEKLMFCATGHEKEELMQSE